MCSASRAVIYTGLHMPHNGIFDNAGVPYMKSLDAKLPTIGKILRKLGYYTAYKGKFHLNAAMAVENQPSDIKALFESVMDRITASTTTLAPATTSKARWAATSTTRSPRPRRRSG